jgi:hypothetical protein
MVLEFEQGRNMTANQSVLAQGARERFRGYDRWLVLLLAVTYLLSWVAIMGGGDTIGVVGLLLMISEMTLVMALDRDGVLSLRGRIPLRLTCLVQLVLFVVVVFLFYIWLIPYLVVAFVDGPGQKADPELAQQHRIAQLEADLGITPTADGNCGQCGQPLQAGAEYCAYCGARVAPA